MTPATSQNAALPLSAGGTALASRETPVSEKFAAPSTTRTEDVRFVEKFADEIDHVPAPHFQSDAPKSSIRMPSPCAASVGTAW